MNSSTSDSARPPLVSVVIPTANRRAILERCLAALIDQTYRHYEVIVVDDGSTDQTREFLRSFAERHADDAFRVLTNPTRMGANASRNRGVRDARGEFVAFEDSDCIAAPDWIEKLVAGFSSDRVAAVTGLVEDTPPTNLYERAFRGTHRLSAGPARRLVGGNLCVRRSLLLERPLDEDLRWGCDEEGLFLWLRAQGYVQSVVPDARVLHDHPYDRTAFFRQAFAGGGATARLVYKYHLPPRLDLLPLALAYLTLPLVFVEVRLWLLPAVLFAGMLAAIGYNELVRKGKNVVELAPVYPVMLAYYHARLAGYVLETIRLRLRSNGIERVRLRRKRTHADFS